MRVYLPQNRILIHLSEGGLLLRRKWHRVELLVRGRAVLGLHKALLHAPGFLGPPDNLPPLQVSVNFFGPDFIPGVKHLSNEVIQRSSLRYYYSKR